MSTRFTNHRLAFFILTFALAGVILGLAANFATIFLPDYHHDFIIFSLVVPSLTILAFLIQTHRGQPRIDAVTLPILSILWLTEAAWAGDIVGPIQCDSLKGQTIPSKNGYTSFSRYCYKLKIIQALSWALFCGFVIALIVLLKLVTQARRYGRFGVWSESIEKMPWFGEGGGYANDTTYVQTPAMYPPIVYPSPAYPSNAIVIHPGQNGAPPQVTHIPPTQG